MVRVVNTNIYGLSTAV